MVNLPNILPINVVGTISGTTASGTPTNIFSLAAVQNVVIVNQDPLEVNLVNGGGGVSSVDSAALFIPFPGSGIDGAGDGTDNVYFELDYPVTVNQATSKLTAGSLTYTISIDSVEIQGLDNQGVTTSRAVDTATSANSYAIGQEFKVAVSGASSATDFRLTIKTTRV